MWYFVGLFSGVRCLAGGNIEEAGVGGGTCQYSCFITGLVRLTLSEVRQPGGRVAVSESCARAWCYSACSAAAGRLCAARPTTSHTSRACLSPWNLPPRPSLAPPSAAPV